MKINKLLMASLAVAALGTTSLSASIDSDIAEKNGLALKQYAQKLKNAATKPHHEMLAGTDTDELLQDAYGRDSNCSVYIAAEVRRAKLRGDEALAALGDDDEILLVAARPNRDLKDLEAHQPADETVGCMKAAFAAAFDKAVGENGVNLKAAKPEGTSMRQIQVAVEAVDEALQTAVKPWIASLHPKGLKVTNFFASSRRASVLKTMNSTTDNLQTFNDYLLAALISH